MLGGHACGEDAAGFVARESHFVVAQGADVDVVGFLKDAHALAGDLSEDAHGQTWAGEGVARDEMLGHAHLAAYAAHLVLKQPLEGFAELKVHLLGQASYVVVALDDFAGDVERLDAVGVDGALGKPATFTI